MKITSFKGTISLTERETMMRIILEECISLGKKKSSDYGGDDCFGNLRKASWLGTLIRLGDKSDRLMNLISLENESDAQIEESIEDNLIDIINYAMFSLIMKRLDHMIFSPTMGIMQIGDRDPRQVPVRKGV
jgi:hypothetical protein